MRTALRFTQLLSLVTLLLCQGAHVVHAGPLERQDDSNSIFADPVPPQNQTVYKPLFLQYSASTPKFNPDALPLVSNDAQESNRARDTSSASSTPVQAEGTCAPGMPCVNGACCSSETGLCGYGPDFCGSGVCISNCDAQAQCGPYAPEGEQRCPLNVCCSIYGFCGSTDEFCVDKCDDTVSDCGAAPEPKGKSGGLVRTIGYYESWATTRPCDQVFPDDLDLIGLTHINFAFAFFHPTSFQMMAMDANAQSQLRDFTAIKRKSRKLQTWIAIGGWSFNDAGNNPDTRTAFSDMAGSSTNRAKFIGSLINFMDNYGFNGADIDWEYPGAEDRGGRPEDTANFVLLCKEMKQAFAGRYGLSVTLPASYWYLKHFDVAKMEPYIDWFNIMSYDIHGVWDADNEFTGPYARPHTNLTQIDQALSLLWRAGVSASNVVLGLAYYGRSFTLADPSCNRPGCRFAEGGKAGACSKAAGVLTLAEIERIRETKDVSEHSDAAAAVKWMTWDSDQWVSYEDENTFQAKIDYALNKGLGGTMIWALDQGVLGSSPKNSLKISGATPSFTSFGISDTTMASFQKQQDAGESCYVSLCGKSCSKGYSPVTTTRGQIGSLGPTTACSGGDWQVLCCASGTKLGTCGWYGYRGQGLSCLGGCPSGSTLLTQNTDRFTPHMGLSRRSVEETCSGGYMSYCCDDFKPSLEPLDQTGLITPDDMLETYGSDSIFKRSFSSCASTALLVGGHVEPMWKLTGPAISGSKSLDNGWVTAGLYTIICLHSLSEAAGIRGYAMTRSQTRKNGNSGTGGGTGTGAGVSKGNSSSKNSKGSKKGASGVRTRGRYTYAIYAASETTCRVTYTCSYGQGFDQACDNQRWGVYEVLGGQRVYHMLDSRNEDSEKNEWLGHIHAHWRGSWGYGPNGGRRRCEGDEFPMGILEESNGRQAVRAIDGGENGRQGNDFSNWKYASWAPCSAVLGRKPPITWAFDMRDLNLNDPRWGGNGIGIIRQYGFDSSSGLAPCYATYTANAQESPVLDHGVRVHSGDPLFEVHNWEKQEWKQDPDKLQSLPHDVASAQFLKRGLSFHFATMTTMDTTQDAWTGTMVHAATITSMKNPSDSNRRV